MLYINLPDKHNADFEQVHSPWEYNLIFTFTKYPLALI